MTKEREALKLGIESLEWHNQHMHRKISEQAIAAMKKALVQPEQDWIERERAVGYREGHQNALKQMAQPEQHQDWCASLTQMLMSTPPKPALCNCKPKPEPMAWTNKMSIDVPNQPLYTAPQRTWVGLTDEEVNKLVDDEDWYNFPHEFAKAIEAKLKEKNT